VVGPFSLDREPARLTQAQGRPARLGRWRLRVHAPRASDRRRARALPTGSISARRFGWFTVVESAQQVKPFVSTPEKAPPGRDREISGTRIASCAPSLEGVDAAVELCVAEDRHDGATSWFAAYVAAIGVLALRTILRRDIA
jgi:hypothetical protein